MENNLYVPNTSAIPNILFDYWMDKLTPAEFKVLMCIARKTYGWHKAIDRISLKQIEKMTGMSRKGITKNIEALIDIGLITKIKSKSYDGDDAPNQYEINVNCMGGGRELSTLGVDDSVHQGVVYSVHPQKKDYTKENIQNKNPLPPKGGTPAGGGGVADSSFSKEPSKKSKQPKPPEIPKTKYLDFVFLTEDEYTNLLLLNGEADLNSMLEMLNAYIGSSGKTYKSHYHALSKGNWVYKRLMEDKAKGGHTTAGGYKRASKMVLEGDKRATAGGGIEIRPEMSRENIKEIFEKKKEKERVENEKHEAYLREIAREKEEQAIRDHERVMARFSKK